MGIDRLDHKFQTSLKKYPDLLAQAVWMADAVFLGAIGRASTRSTGRDPTSFQDRNLHLAQIAGIFDWADCRLNGKFAKPLDWEATQRASIGESPMEIGKLLWPTIKKTSASEKAVEAAFRGWKVIGWVRDQDDLFLKDFPATLREPQHLQRENAHSRGGLISTGKKASSTESEIRAAKAYQKRAKAT